MNIKKSNEYLCKTLATIYFIYVYKMQSSCYVAYSLYKVDSQKYLIKDY